MAIFGKKEQFDSNSVSLYECIMLPLDIILVRHGESEGNFANKASRRGDNGFFTDEFRNRHSRTFRLTNKGIAQAKAAGVWIKANVHRPIQRFYVSDHIRAKETAAHMQLPDAQWRVEFHLRERDHALTDNIPDNEKRTLFPREHHQYELDPFLSIPAGGGESFAQHCFRMKGTMLDHWARRHAERTILAVCHGHVMRALQVEIEGMTHDDFLRLNASDDPADKIRNCQILWFSRFDPDTGVRAENPVAVRSVCPWAKNGDFGWRRIVRRKYSNKELLKEVARYPRQVKGG